ncbi:hypothetical protein MMC07_009691 [Pseudocyphellaria aurata]|nr:hypothetical protein [Pseudocyphellaria aurata]
MAFLFRTKPKSDLAKPAKELVTRLWQPPVLQKTEEELAKLLAQMKSILQGTQETESSPDQISHLVTSILQEDLLYSLARSIHMLPFESRKDTQTIFSCVLRFKPLNAATSEPPALAHVVNQRPEIIIELCRGYEHRESAMPCGFVLREALKHEAIAAIILHDKPETKPAANLNEIDPDVKQGGEGVFWKFFPWIDEGAFEVSTDAFTTFRDILTKHKELVSQYLSTNFEIFFRRYNEILVKSSSYVTQRQSIKLLGELLLDRENYNTMTEYVKDGEHLKLCMKLLKDEHKMVQYEGFHVFKVFVANPKKSVAVQRILFNNRERLLNFLPKFLKDRTDDDQFSDEKSYLIRQIEIMAPPPAEEVTT